MTGLFGQRPEELILESSAHKIFSSDVFRDKLHECKE